MTELSSATIPHAIENAIREHMPTIKLSRNQPTGELTEEELPLNVYRNAGDADLVTVVIHDPERNTNCFPFIFIRQESRQTISKKTIGGYAADNINMGMFRRYTYSYLISVNFYIDQSPLDRYRIPRSQEEMDKMELMLERVLQEIEMFGMGDIYPTELQMSYVSEAGVLLTTRTVIVTEDTIPSEYPILTSSEMHINLPGDLEVD